MKGKKTTVAELRKEYGGIQARLDANGRKLDALRDRIREMKSRICDARLREYGKFREGDVVSFTRRVGSRSVEALGLISEIDCYDDECDFWLTLSVLRKDLRVSLYRDERIMDKEAKLRYPAKEYRKKLNKLEREESSRRQKRRETEERGRNDSSVLRKFSEIKQVV